MTVWGGFTNHLRIGLDVSNDAVGPGTTAVNVYFTWYVQCDSSWNFQDTQTLVETSPQSLSWTFFNNENANGIIAVGSGSFVSGVSYGSSPTYNFASNLQGVYLGAGPSFSFNYTLPARPPSPPGAPSTPTASSIKAQSAIVSFTASGTTNGAAIDDEWVDVATDTGFTNIVWQDGVSSTATSYTATGLVPGTTYHVRARSHNSAGWGAFSGTGTFTTSSFQVPPLTITVTGPTTETVTWSHPTATDTATGYQLQYDTHSNFSAPTTITSATWGTSANLTGLASATTYYVRVRANTSTGYGAYSATGSTTTLSGAKVLVAGVWQNCPAFVKVNGAWQTATVWKKKAGTWQT